MSNPRWCQMALEYACDNYGVRYVMGTWLCEPCAKIWDDIEADGFPDELDPVKQ